MKSVVLVALVGLLVLPASAARTLSSSSVISVLTCSPGEDLYSVFGHSAIRIQDPEAGVDSVYNYGTFDFETAGFYLKFAQGRLNYMLSRQYFPIFQHEYLITNRWVKEQRLLLDSTDTQRLYELLETNYRPENRFYRYDFFYDNCATRIRDILREALGERLIFNLPEETGLSFRNRVETYTESMPWSAFGIYLALGWPYEKEMHGEEIMFLPDGVLAAFDGAKLDGRALVAVTEDLLLREDPENATSRPSLWIAGVIYLVLASLAFIFRHKIPALVNSAAYLVASITGLTGLILGLLWVATDHEATRLNPDLLWLSPLNLLLLPFSGSRRKYFAIAAFTCSVTLLLTFAGVFPWYCFPWQAATALFLWVMAFQNGNKHR
jgi:hypothetical protein